MCALCQSPVFGCLSVDSRMIEFLRYIQYQFRRVMKASRAGGDKCGPVYGLSCGQEPVYGLRFGGRKKFTDLVLSAQFTDLVGPVYRLGSVPAFSELSL